MINGLQNLTLVVVAFTMIPAVAHALELPGKMRLTKEVYFEVQRIYYPGFTFAGVAGPAGIVLNSALLLELPREAPGFWSASAALWGLLAMEIIYWVAIHPINKVWMKNLPLTSAASGFFRFGQRHTGIRASDWTSLRNRWEYAHAARAAVAFCQLRRARQSDAEGSTRQRPTPS